ncbi:MAG: hypothetical protein A3H71_01285 [Candidatus Sungbacteria bacterium RIFCSPLOWO2_02_FULL_48_13b]|uniref:Four helix bundle protein n=2 Tax=Candidatus Sungiibacteriota TaxID=1817917 RepID=A0A1G2LKY7_9BACT|nr:MAG: hypothetical protein A3C12_02490 [Candidatus Sungbacteria bacterium RIFCSPHIGHO2_02_FULL_49_20]OHA11519.1 MAG: hypothetical protein A3H71_01285 [Candidatus Sungbacteria bacterium RIFCSPLOWO2_02_FULL_48_13b]
MATVRQFEDLLAWQKARLLVKEIYKAFRDCRDRGFTDQIQRASVSVMSNIVHPVRSQTPKASADPQADRTSNGARGSAGEVRAQLYAAFDIGYLNIETFKSLNQLAIECSRLIASFIKGLKSSQFVGTQYKKEKSKAQLERDEFDQAIDVYLKEVKENPGAKFDLSKFQKGG